MRIAIVGWGSLLWNQGRLNLGSKWRKDGPMLPIEFARTSNNGTITLVTTPTWGTPIRTYWATSGETDLNAARANLQERERTPSLSNIAAVTRSGEFLGRESAREVASLVLEWLAPRDLEGAVWTGLGAKGIEHMTDGERREWAAGLPTDAAERIADYVRRAPAQVRTPFRDLLTRHYRWDRIPVPAEAFEECTSADG